jgi:hypothetical protein
MLDIDDPSPCYACDALDVLEHRDSFGDLCRRIFACDDVELARLIASEHTEPTTLSVALAELASRDNVSKILRFKGGWR